MQNTATAGPLRAIGGGVAVALLSLVFSFSYATAVFSGPLEAFRAAGITMALTGSIVFGAFAAVRGSAPGTWWGGQSPPVVLLAIGSAHIAAALEGASDDARLATVAVFSAACTFLAGLTLVALGRARVGRQARFIPYPVIGGFLAATGFFLVARGAELASGQRTGLQGLVAEADPWRALPHVAGGALVAVLARRVGAGAAILIAVLLYAAALAAYLWANGLGMDALRGAGLTLATAAAPPPLLVPVTAHLGAADLGAIADEAWTIGAIALLTILGLVVTVAALEVQMARPFDVDRDMADAGVANMIAAAGCGFVGFHSLTVHQLSRSVLPEPSPASCVVAVLVILGTLVGASAFGGIGVLSHVPVGIFALVLCYLGIELLWRWLVTAWREMPRGDYAIVVTILAVAVAVDFVTAIVLGTLAASILFTLAYSRLDVVRSRLSGRLRLSPTERPEGDVATLLARGRQTLVFELQGYLFFGTASGLRDRIEAELTAPGAGIRDLLLDFRRVKGMDVSTAQALLRLADVARRTGVDVTLTGLSPALRDRLGPARAIDGGEAGLALADALQRIEDRLLAEAWAEAGAPTAPAAPALPFGALLAEATEAGLPLVHGRHALAPGEVLYAQGDPGDVLGYLEAGRLSAWVALPDGGSRRVASFLPGAVVGEIAFSTGSRRTATVIADEPCRILTVTQASLEAAARIDPPVGARLHALLARLLAKRLERTTALLSALDD